MKQGKNGKHQNFNEQGKKTSRTIMYGEKELRADLHPKRRCLCA